MNKFEVFLTEKLFTGNHVASKWRWGDVVRTVALVGCPRGWGAGARLWTTTLICALYLSGQVLRVWWVVFMKLYLPIMKTSIQIVIVSKQIAEEGKHRLESQKNANIKAWQLRTGLQIISIYNTIITNLESIAELQCLIYNPLWP